MKIPFKGLLIALVLFTILDAWFSAGFAQGSLTPPGPPGATMLTLQQIEPHTPISSAPFVIRQPGAYYLTTNLTVASGHAIIIATNGVTVDLNGFTLKSIEASFCLANTGVGTAYAVSHNVNSY